MENLTATEILTRWREQAKKPVPGDGFMLELVDKVNEILATYGVCVVKDGKIVDTKKVK